MGKLGSILYDTSRKISKRVSNLRKKNPRRLPWRDQPDFVYGRYFLWTIPYGLFYIIGAGVGFGRTGNWFCLGISGGCGIVIFFLGVAHSIDYYRGVNLEAVYLAIPFVISLFVGIFMTCVYGMGATLKIALPVAIIAWLSVVFFMYAVAKEHGDGEYHRENIYVKAGNNSVDHNVIDVHDLVNATDEEREQFRKTVTQNLAEAFNMPDLKKGFKQSVSSTDGETRQRENQRLLDRRKK